MRNSELLQIISFIGLIPEPFYHCESLPRLQTAHYDCTSSELIQKPSQELFQETDILDLLTLSTKRKRHFLWVPKQLLSIKIFQVLMLSVVK